MSAARGSVGIRDRCFHQFFDEPCPMHDDSVESETRGNYNAARKKKRPWIEIFSNSRNRSLV